MSFTQLLKAAYWKPIQSGDLDNSDSQQIQNLAEQVSEIIPERYRLSVPASPHESAEKDNVKIKLEEFVVPNTKHSLIVEGAGGLFVPINEEHFIIDIIEKVQLPIILVVRDYLGCINHTMLSIKALENKGIPVHILVFNGEFNPATKAIIEKHLPANTQIIQIPTLKEVNRITITTIAKELSTQLKLN